MPHPADEFVLREWMPAFTAMKDNSPPLLAGLAVTVNVRRIDYVKKALGGGLKPKKVWDEPAERPYYLVTEKGLHVGQKRPSHELPEGYSGNGPVVDYFVPHDEITSAEKSQYGLNEPAPDGLTAVVRMGDDAAFVQIRLFDVGRQFSGHTVGPLPAEAQRTNIISVLIDGAVPEIETAGKVCPDCAETVRAMANVCRYCGHRFDS